MIEELYYYYVKNPESLPEHYKVLIDLKNEPLERVVCDYIAGMSDQYSISKFEEIYVPKAWKG